MKGLRFTSGAAFMGASVALLAGCGQTGIAPTQATPTIAQGSSRAPHSSNDLLYVVMHSTEVKVFSYPGLVQVGALKSSDLFGYASSNPNNGNVLLNHVLVYEYTHGASKPAATIDPPYRHAAYDNAYDPATNDIAITWFQNGDEVAVYKSPSGTPKTYTDSGMPNMRFLGYDGHGNLFVDGLNGNDGYVLAELPKGDSRLKNLSVPPQLSEMRAIQWDGRFVTIQGARDIYRVQVSGSTVRVIGKTSLAGAWWAGGGQFWIQGDTVIGPHLTPGKHQHNGRNLGFWHYPAGGNAYSLTPPLGNSVKDRVYSETVSI
jgi:hypothetical protein